MSEVPMSVSLFGHCQDAKDFAEFYDPREIARFHLNCPAVIPARQWPDPAGNGTTFFTLPGRRCPCACHTRPVVSDSGD
jgi:hypothetical protein